MGGRTRARGRLVARRRAPLGADRQGHADLRLSAGSRARSGPLRGGRGRLPVRSPAHARGRLSDPRAPTCGGHRDQRVAQSVRRQRHQVLLRRRRQASRQPRAVDRKRDGALARVRAVGATGQSAPHRRRRRPVHRVLQVDVPDRARPQRLADRRRLCARRRVQRCAAGVPRAGGRRHCDRRRAERPQHQRRRRRDECEASQGGGRRAQGRYRHCARRRWRSPADGRPRRPRSTAISSST